MSEFECHSVRVPRPLAAWMVFHFPTFCVRTSSGYLCGLLLAFDKVLIGADVDESSDFRCPNHLRYFLCFELSKIAGRNTYVLDARKTLEAILWEAIFERET